MNNEKKATLEKLVNEFNNLGIIAPMFIRADIKVKVSGEFHFGDYHLVMNTTRISSGVLKEVYPFILKYNASFGIHPVRGNDVLCIRISSSF